MTSGQVNSQGEVLCPTIKPTLSFNPELDCRELRSAIQGMGTDESAIIQILANRSSLQRVQLAPTYSSLFKKDLIKEMRSDLSGHFEDLVVEMLTDPVLCDVQALRDALSGIGTNEGTLAEILFTRSNQRLQQIRDVYYKTYNKSLDDDLRGDSSGYCEKLYLAALQGSRTELTPAQILEWKSKGSAAVVDVALAQKEASDLRAAGENTLGTEEGVFIRILCGRSLPQLQATFAAYEKLVGKPLSKSINSETSGELCRLLKDSFKANNNRTEYFAKRINQCLVGPGTKDRRLIRLLISRSEIDLGLIKQVYQNKYNKSLDDAIKEDTSGNYQKLLLAVLQGN